MGIVVLDCMIDRGDQSITAMERRKWIALVLHSRSLGHPGEQHV
ncbi:hypothetical protein [Stenotrophomonas sp.]|nr:hypothetical protein [Stenotrophomonas sp.]